MIMVADLYPPSFCNDDTPAVSGAENKKDINLLFSLYISYVLLKPNLVDNRIRNQF